jgi:hypothetical protein
MYSQRELDISTKSGYPPESMRDPKGYKRMDRFTNGLPQKHSSINKWHQKIIATASLALGPIRNQTAHT